MSLTFSQRAALLGGVNRSTPPFVPPSLPAHREGNLTYLQPGDTWQDNDLYESDDGVHVVGSNSRAKPGDKVDEIWMRVEPRRYRGANS